MTGQDMAHDDKALSSDGPKGQVRPASDRPDSNWPRDAILPWARARKLVLPALVLVPSLIYAAYSVVATDRYASSTSFVVRSSGAAQGGGGELLESITGSVSSGSTKSDSYIVRNFILSPDLVRLVDQRFDLTRLYGDPAVDWFQRLAQDATFEEKVDYWQKRVKASYDHTTGIIDLEVQAYDPETAAELTRTLMGHILDLVNNLSATARASTYDIAKDELHAAESFMRDTQGKMLDFRARTGIVDPAISAARDDELVRELNREIVTKKVSVDQLERTIKVPGPNVTQMRDTITSLETQRDSLLKRMADETGVAMVTAELMNEYEALALDFEIAKTRYARTLEGVENARRDSERHQRYMAVYAEPYAADEAAYPRRILNTLIVFVSSLLLVSIAGFLVGMVRDHRK